VRRGAARGAGARFMMREWSSWIRPESVSEMDISATNSFVICIGHAWRLRECLGTLVCGRADTMNFDGEDYCRQAHVLLSDAGSALGPLEVRAAALHLACMRHVQPVARQFPLPVGMPVRRSEVDAP